MKINTNHFYELYPWLVHHGTIAKLYSVVPIVTLFIYMCRNLFSYFMFSRGQCSRRRSSIFDSYLKNSSVLITLNRKDRSIETVNLFIRFWRKTKVWQTWKKCERICWEKKPEELHWSCLLCNNIFI